MLSIKQVIYSPNVGQLWCIILLCITCPCIRMFYQSTVFANYYYSNIFIFCNYFSKVMFLQSNHLWIFLGLLHFFSNAFIFLLPLEEFRSSCQQLHLFLVPSISLCIAMITIIDIRKLTEERKSKRNPYFFFWCRLVDNSQLFGYCDQILWSRESWIRSSTKASSTRV